MTNNFFDEIPVTKKIKFKTILILAFEDDLLIKLTENSFPNAKIDSLAKQDLNGKSIKEILKLTNRQRYDLVIISNRFSLVNRTENSLKLLAFLSRAYYSLIIFNDNEAKFYSKFKLLIEIIPRFIFFCVLSLFILIRAYTFFFLIAKFFKKRYINTAKGRRIAFLRTDLAGKLIAGGSISHIKGFITGAKKLGFEVTLISDDDFPGIDTIKIKPNPYLDFFDEIQLIDYHFRFIKQAKKILNKIKPDIIYQRHSIFNASGVILSKYLNIPLILEVNHSEVWVKKNWSRLFFEMLATKIEKFAFAFADVIGVVSSISREEISKLGADMNKIVVNPNGVDESKFHPDIDGTSIRKKFNLSNKFVVGFTGTFTKWHGVETLFESAINICSLNDDVFFLLIGDGNLKTKLQAETQKLGLTHRIIFTGMIPHNEVPEYLSACDVLVSPHLGFQSGERFFGSPTKLFEYLAMGKPVIASDLEQIGEIIQHEFNGLKFKPGDVNELTENILRLYNEPDLRSKLGINARQTVIKSYTWTENAKRVLAAISKF